jgi:hypothetical protein
MKDFLFLNEIKHLNEIDLKYQEHWHIYRFSVPEMGKNWTVHVSIPAVYTEYNGLSWLLCEKNSVRYDDKWWSLDKLPVWFQEIYKKIVDILNERDRVEILFNNKPYVYDKTKNK